MDKSTPSKEKPLLELLGDVSEVAIEGAGSGIEKVDDSLQPAKHTQDKQKEQSGESSGTITQKIKQAAKPFDPNKPEPSNLSTNPIVKVLVVAGVIIAAIGLLAMFANVGLGVLIILLGIVAIFIGVFAPIQAKKKQRKAAG